MCEWMMIMNVSVNVHECHMNEYKYLKVSRQMVPITNIMFVSLYHANTMILGFDWVHSCNAISACQ